MFLTAVLQAHTDSLTQVDDDAGHDTPTRDPLEDTSVRLPRLDETLSVPAHERIQVLPSAHRSRWV